MKINYTGVDHFFIYNTIYPAERQHELADILIDYIRQEIVTLVAWPYANCAMGIGASGRSISFIDPDNANPASETDYDKHLFWFHPPNRITQSSALASCYTRFRHTTKYMAHIDDDEFFKVAHPSGPQINPEKPLLHYTDAMFANFPAAPAIKFTPVMMVTCPAPADFDFTTSDFGALLPRLGKHPFGRMGRLGDGKMIMRTDAVDMFFVHYLTALATGVKQRQSLMSHPRRAVLLHYKTSPHLSGNDITGRRIPLNTTFEALDVCASSFFLPLDRPPSDELRAQQKIYALHREHLQLHFMFETFCVPRLKHCDDNVELSSSQECIQNRKYCADREKWNATELSKKEDFTSHYFEKQFIRSLSKNVQHRLLY